MLQQGLLHVHPVLRLLEDARLRALEHVLGDLLAPVRRQTVEHHRTGPRAGEQRGVDGEAPEGLQPRGGLGLLPHAGPDVGHHHLGAGDGLARVPGQHQVPPGGLGLGGRRAELGRERRAAA